MARYIGVRHRCKRTREGEARPTTVAIRDGDRTMVYELENDTAELDFLMCRWPISWRKVKDEDEIQYYDEATKQGVRIRHCKLRRAEEGEDLTPLHPTHVLQVPDLESGKITTMKVVTHVPVTYEGLQSGDVVGMVLGGSGKNFASALSRRGEEVGAQVYRLPPFTLADKRGEASKNDDHLLLARLVEYEQSLFYLVRLSDRDMIRTAEALFLKISAMKSRIACGQRLAQRMVGRIFLSEEGRYPEGVIEDLVPPSFNYQH